jgi:hypothetical protein
MEVLEDEPDLGATKMGKCTLAAVAYPLPGKRDVPARGPFKTAE